VIRLGVLASGGGTNLQAILDACGAQRIDAQVAVVVSNVPGAGALERARVAGVATEVLPSKGAADREAYDLRLVEALRAARVDLVCLAGYMRLVTPAFLRAFASTPATRGCPRFAGCTVHFVDEGTDTGAVIAQAIVPVLPDDDEPRLAARILSEEHRLYPQAIHWFAEGRLSMEGRRVRVDGARIPAAVPVANPIIEIG
jgi:phosphoribosylglycinamide formyltransferase-1